MTKEMTMADLLNDFDVKKISSGDILNGEIIDVNEKGATVNINYAFDGIISRNELSSNDENPVDVVKAGDKISVYVIAPNNGEGYVQLSRVRALSISEREDLKRAFKNNEIIKVLVKEEVKGGLVANYGTIRIFIPASLASRERIELKTLVGKELEVKLTELDFRNRKVVASRRELEEAVYNENKKLLWSKVQAGEKRAGKVVKILKFGAIVDIGGITGLVHINDLAWGRVKRVEDVVKVGDEVEVVVGEVDAAAERVSLVLKDVNSDPWTVNKDNIKVGAVLEGKVSKLMAFGAFVELFPGVEGLVHLSEISEDHIAKVEDALTAGQSVKVKVLAIEEGNKRISLSIKEAIERSTEYLQYNDNEEGATLGDLFKDLF